MAETPVEVVIRARNEAQAALNQAVGQLRQLEQQTKAVGDAGRSLGPLRDALGAISPAASGAVQQIETLAKAGASLGAAGAVAAGIAGGIGLISVAALGAAKSLADMVEQLDNVATATGTNAGDVQVLQEVFKRAGLGAELAVTSLNKLNIAIGANSPTLKTLGVDAKDPIQALLQLSDAFASSTNAGARAVVAQELLGKGSKDLLAVIDSLRLKFPELSAEMERTKQKLDPEMLEAGRRADEMFERFGGRVEGFTNKLKLAAAESLRFSMDPLVMAFFGVDKAADTAGAGVAQYAKALGPMTQAEAAAAKAIEDAARALDKGKHSIDEHTKSVNELVKLLGLERGEADRLVKSQEALANARRKAALQKELFEPKEIGGVEVKAKRPEGFLPGEIGFGPQQPKPGEPGFIGPEGRKFGEPGTVIEPPEVMNFDKVLLDWHAFLDEITSGTAVLDESINTLLQGMTAGFSSVFQSVLLDGQKFSTSMVGFFRQMVSAMLAQLSRLLAFKLLAFLLPGAGLPLAALSAAVDISGGGGSPALRGGTKGAQQTTDRLSYSMDQLTRTLSSSLPQQGAAVPGQRSQGEVAGASIVAQPAQQVTYNINALDAHSLVMSLVLPRGGLRRAGDRVAVAGSY